MDELLKDFLTETAEQIEAVGTQLVLLERDPSDAAMIASIFRLVHTIKGACGFLGLSRLGQLAHAAETLIWADSRRGHAHARCRDSHPRRDRPHQGSARRA